MKTRPLGVSVMAVLYFISVATYGALALLSAASPDKVRSLLTMATTGAEPGPAPLLVLGAFLPVYFLAMALASYFLGRGMWRLKQWAWIVTVILCGVSLAVGGIELLRSMHGMDAMARATAWLRIGFTALVIWYLGLRRVREAFRKRKDGDSGAA
jgi:hypothetical protein